VRPAGRTGRRAGSTSTCCLYDDLILREPGLTLPHPRLLERAFVRVPLAEVAAPALRHPETGAPLDEREGGLRRVAEL
jgi:7,8-dihydro-6-hydroxymethylpterin-pyrophosphokinase